MKREYTFPTLCVYSFVAEKGFAQSLGVDITDYTKGYDDVLDD